RSLRRSYNDIHVETYQLSRQIRELVVLSLRRSELNDIVLSFHVPKLAKPFLQCRIILQAWSDRSGGEVAYSVDLCRLPRAHGKRPSGGGSSNYFDEFAALHCLPQGSGPRQIRR